MKQKKKIKLIATIVILIIILIMIILGYTEYIKKNKLIKNNINALNNGDITTIDITGITPSPESQHEHIYKTHYDDTKHWEECTVCSLKRNEKNHVLIDKGWSMGENCTEGNIHSFLCECGYKYSTDEGKKQHQWTYGNNSASYQEYQWCDGCNAGIFTDCYKSDGSIISCGNLGTCVKCGYTYTNIVHGLEIEYTNDIENIELRCVRCNKYLGNLNYAKIIKYSNTQYYVESSVTRINGTNNDRYIESHNFGIDGSYSYPMKDLTNGSTHTQGGTFNIFNYREGGGRIGGHHRGICNGETSSIGIFAIIDKIDNEEPVISDIKASNNTEWAKFKSITITGTENWTNTVNIKIENDRGKVVYEGSSNVTNNNWSISCTPEIEAGEESRTFIVTVTDACENSTTKNFNISKVDGRPPTVTSSDKVTNSEWAKEKTFTFTAEDLGIGNVEIGFNDVNDYSPAVKSGNNYSKEYKFVGDAYSKVTASVYFKDGLENITTQLVTLEKIDNTAPTITNATLNNNVVNIIAHDRHRSLGEGSGVVKYRYITSTEKLENPEITLENSQQIGKDETLTIANINDVKYIYVVAEDLVGNQSESYEIEVPQLELTSKVNEENTITLDWTGYNITDKYFVIYCKQEDEEEWKTIVGIEQKLNNNTYTLGNDISKPNIPEITIEKDIEANHIKIKGQAQDNGTKYTYYIEAYDKNTNTLIAKSNINKR